MSNLTYDQQRATIGNRQITREMQRYFGEKDGSAEEFQEKIDRFRIANGFKPLYRKEGKE